MFLNRRGSTSRNIDAMVVVLGILPLTLAGLIGKLGLSGFLIAVGWQTARHWRVIPVRLLPAWPIFLFPILAVFSTIWSEAPLLTYRNSIQFLLSIYFAVLIARTVPIATILRASMAAFVASLACAFLLGQTVNLVGGSRAFIGIYGSKNAASFFCGVTLLMSLGVLTKRRTAGWGWHLGASLGSVLGAAGLVLSRSSGGLISFAAATMSFGALLLIRRCSTAVQVLMLLSLLAIVPTALLAKPALDRWTESFMVEKLGKDVGLTGRAEIWERGDQLIAAKPLLGYGFKAFWRQGSLNAEGLWREHGIPERAGFNFHSQLRDVMIDLGVTGLILFALPLLIGFPLLLWKAMVGDQTYAPFAAVMAGFLGLLPIESSIVNQFSPEIFVFYIGCCLGLAGSVDSRRYKPKRSRSLRQVTIPGQDINVATD